MYEVAIVFFFFFKRSSKTKGKRCVNVAYQLWFFCVLEDKLRVFVFRDSSLIRLTAGKTMPNTALQDND